ncbi:hypothetical protein SLS53_007775 [Cytospora paraplurivora]|uniref:Uncharacterized protein n=1 Tax=Cytospora paraplurivora TaxID=2898453 RepID=A0AAN9YCP6_9PEZI
MADSSSEEVHNAPRENVRGAAANQQELSSQDRPRRFSQYAEANANPLPEIAVESVPEPSRNMEQLDCDDTASTHPVVEPDDPVDRRGSAVVYAGEAPSRFRRYRIWIIVGLVIAVIILTGTVVGVLVSKNNHGGGSGGNEHSYCVHGQHDFVVEQLLWQLLDHHQLDYYRSGLSSGSQHHLYIFVLGTVFHRAIIKGPNPVSFMNVVGGNGYNVRYYATDDATACCTYCYTQVTEGCDSWAWMGGFIGTACSMITGWKGSDSDDTCPQGHTTVNFQQTANNASQVGGVGPCATLVQHMPL